MFKIQALACIFALFSLASAAPILPRSYRSDPLIPVYRCPTCPIHTGCSNKSGECYDDAGTTHSLDKRSTEADNTTTPVIHGSPGTKEIVQCGPTERRRCYWNGYCYCVNDDPWVPDLKFPQDRMNHPWDYEGDKSLSEDPNV